MAIDAGGVWNERIDLVITDALDIPYTFSSRTLIVVASISGSPDTWIRAGYLTKFFTHPSFGKIEASKRYLVRLNQPIYYSFPLLILDAESPTLGYQLHFEPMDWISQLTLKIYEPTMPLEFEPLQQSAIRGSTASTTSINTSASSLVLLAANTDRKFLRISNNSNKDLYINFGATTSLASFIAKLPKLSGGIAAAFEDNNYTGVVSGIWESAGSGSALISEVTS